MSRLAGKVAIITGGAGGIGAATARRFVAEGASVVIGDITDVACDAVAAECGAPARSVHLDVRDPDDWTRAVEVATAEFGRLDVLINNAAVWLPANLLDITIEQIRLSVDVNVMGPLLGMQAVSPAIKESGGGSIVNISSGAGLGGYPGQIVYGSTKWAIRGMTKTAAMELGGDDAIRVNSIHPGPVATAMTAAMASSDPHRFDRLPIPRSAQPEEIASLAVYLASDESAYMTGSEVSIDGGLGAGPSIVNPAKRLAPLGRQDSAL